MNAPHDAAAVEAICRTACAADGPTAAPWDQQLAHQQEADRETVTWWLDRISEAGFAIVPVALAQSPANDGVQP